MLCGAGSVSAAPAGHAASNNGTSGDSSAARSGRIEGTESDASLWPLAKGAGVSVSAGTLGVGLSAAVQALDPWLNLRVQVNYLAFGHNFGSDGNDYNGTLHFFSAGLLADAYPFAAVPILRVFHITGGVYLNQNKLRGDAQCSGSKGCTVGDLRIKSVGRDPARLDAELSFRPFAPYAGIGFGNAMAGSHWHFGLELGALFSGTPHSSMRARGTADIQDKNTGLSRSNVNVATDPQVQQELGKQRAKLKHDIGTFSVYPVITFTIGYRFGG